MALSVDQLITIRRAVGTAPSDAELNDIYTRTADVDELILEVLEIRLADLKRNPSSFSVPGEYSQSTGENIAALEKSVAALGGGGSLVRIIEPEPRRNR